MSDFAPIVAEAGGAVTVTIQGANFAPTADLRCVHRGRSVEVEWLSNAMLRCELPDAPSGSYDPVSVLSHGRLGNSSTKLTFYGGGGGGDGDGSGGGGGGGPSVPIVQSVTPPFGSLSPTSDHVHVLLGANFAPTGALRCRFGFDAAGDVDAIYISPVSIACQRPPFTAPMDVPIVASTDGGVSFSTTAARFTFYDDGAPPSVSSYAPRYGGAAGGTRIDVRGANFAPHPLLKCTLGGVDAAATFASAALVRCMTPPSASALGSDDVTLSVHVGDTGAPGAGAVAAGRFTYHRPDTAPQTSSVAPRYGASTGGVAVTIHGTNFAPTGDLLCMFGLREPVVATFVSHAAVTCVAPSHPHADVRVAVSTAGEHALPLDLAHAGGGARHFTYYDPRESPSSTAARPVACDLSAAQPCVVEVTGANFAPLERDAGTGGGGGGGGLVCAFKGGGAYNLTTSRTVADDLLGGSACSNRTCGLYVNASFTSARMARCAAPLHSALPGDYTIHIAHSLGRAVEWVEAGALASAAAARKSPLSAAAPPPAADHIVPCGHPAFTARVTPACVIPTAARSSHCADTISHARGPSTAPLPPPVARRRRRRP